MLRNLVIQLQRQPALLWARSGEWLKKMLLQAVPCMFFNRWISRLMHWIRQSESVNKSQLFFTKAVLAYFSKLRPILKTTKLLKEIFTSQQVIKYFRWWPTNTLKHSNRLKMTSWGKLTKIRKLSSLLQSKIKKEPKSKTP